MLKGKQLDGIYHNMNILILGNDLYEKIGIKTILSKNLIRSIYFNSNINLSQGDVIIICASSAPLLGWWKYLYLAYIFNKQYGMYVIITCPEKIHNAFLIRKCGITLISGSISLYGFSDNLLSAIRYFIEKKTSVTKDTNSFWESFLTNISKYEKTCQKNSTTNYHYRSTLLQRLGFESWHVLRVFMTGYL